MSACNIPFHLTREQIIEQLAAHGLKPTEQRLRIAELLMSSPTHITAEQILASVRQGDDPVSKATVYNTLNALVGSGLVRQIQRRSAGRIYRAIAHGDIAEPGSVEAPIGRHRVQRTRMAVVAGGRDRRPPHHKGCPVRQGRRGRFPARRSD